MARSSRLSATARNIAVVAFDGISPFHLAVPCLVFGEDRTDAGVQRSDVKVCALERGPLRRAQAMPSWRRTAAPL